MTKKDTAAEFLKLVSSGNVSDAFEKYVHTNFIHHDPYFKGDASSFKEAMEEDGRKNPIKFLKVEHSLEDEGIVAVHSHIQKQSGIEITAIHLFRFEDDKIVELWDAAMVLPEDSPNENGAF